MQMQTLEKLEELMGSDLINESGRTVESIK